MKRRLSIKDVTVWTLIVIYSWVIVKVVLFKMHPAEPAFLWQQLKVNLANPRLVAEGIQQGNLIPFHEISTALREGTDHRMLNFIGNIVLFVPLGMLLPLVLRNDRLQLTRTALISLSFSLLLECSQALLSIGAFDVDDLILNTFGGWFGCIVVRSLLEVPVTLSHNNEQA